jgi:hypothetical protein
LRLCPHGSAKEAEVISVASALLRKHLPRTLRRSRFLFPFSVMAECILYGEPGASTTMVKEVSTNEKKSWDR